MSSLSATQADGYYIPPSYIDSGKYKKQSLNQFAGSKGHNQYLQRSVVRFELPYDGFCLSCGAHVGKGTRFNARKDHAGDYYTTKIWEFTTKCRACGGAEFKIRTNPRERGFDYVEVRIGNRSAKADLAKNRPSGELNGTGYAMRKGLTGEAYLFSEGELGGMPPYTAAPCPLPSPILAELLAFCADVN